MTRFEIALGENGSKRLLLLAQKQCKAVLNQYWCIFTFFFVMASFEGLMSFYFFWNNFPKQGSCCVSFPQAILISRLLLLTARPYRSLSVLPSLSISPPPLCLPLLSPAKTFLSLPLPSQVSCLPCCSLPLYFRFLACLAPSCFHSSHFHPSPPHLPSCLTLTKHTHRHRHMCLDCVVCHSLTAGHVLSNSWLFTPKLSDIQHSVMLQYESYNSW